MNRHSAFLFPVFALSAIFVLFSVFFASCGAGRVKGEEEKNPTQSAEPPSPDRLDPVSEALQTTSTTEENPVANPTAVPTLTPATRTCVTLDPETVSIQFEEEKYVVRDASGLMKQIFSTESDARNHLVFLKDEKTVYFCKVGENITYFIVAKGTSESDLP